MTRAKAWGSPCWCSPSRPGWPAASGPSVTITSPKTGSSVSLNRTPNLRISGGATFAAFRSTRRARRRARATPRSGPRASTSPGNPHVRGGHPEEYEVLPPPRRLRHVERQPASQRHVRHGRRRGLRLHRRPRRGRGRSGPVVGRLPDGRRHAAHPRHQQDDRPARSTSRTTSPAPARSRSTSRSRRS